MSDRLDYEATKAALRAQVAEPASPGPHLPSGGWRVFSAAASVVVIVCAVTLTLWITRGGSDSQMVLVPSADTASRTATPARAVTDPTSPDPAGDVAVPPAGAIAPVDPAAAPAIVDDVNAPLTAPERRPAAPVVPAPGAVAPRTDVADTTTSAPTRTGGGSSRPAVRPAPANPPVTQPPVVTPPITQPPSTPSPTTGGGGSDPGGGGQSADDPGTGDGAG